MAVSAVRHALSDESQMILVRFAGAMLHPRSGEDSGGTGILPVRSGREKPHGHLARATGVGPIDSTGPANLSWREMTRARNRYMFIETALV